MAQIIVNVEDVSLLAGLKRVILSIFERFEAGS